MTTGEGMPVVSVRKEADKEADKEAEKERSARNLHVDDRFDTLNHHECFWNFEGFDGAPPIKWNRLIDKDAAQRCAKFPLNGRGPKFAVLATRLRLRLTQASARFARSSSGEFADLAPDSKVLDPGKSHPRLRGGRLLYSGLLRLICP